jgi:hypothetical protein
MDKRVIASVTGIFLVAIALVIALNTFRDKTARFTNLLLAPTVQSVQPSPALQSFRSTVGPDGRPSWGAPILISLDLATRKAQKRETIVPHPPSKSGLVGEQGLP